jgi:hypothetical protein
MKKIFLALGSCFAFISADPSEIVDASTEIGHKLNPKKTTVIDYQRRLNRANKEIKNAKDDLLEELEINSESFDNDIDIKSRLKKIYSSSSSRWLANFKQKNKCSKILNLSEEICDQLQKNPNIELFTVDNLSTKIGSDSISMGQTVFIDSKLANNSGIIMREIGNIVNEDRTNWLIIRDLVVRRLERKKYLFIPYTWLHINHSIKILDLFNEFSQKVEKKADLWSAANCKDCANQLVDYFKLMKDQSPSKGFPDTAERIGYLS